MGMFPNGKMLLKMLGVIVVLFIIILAISFFTNPSGYQAPGTTPAASYLGLLIPFGLFAFIIYKSGKKGLLTILVFIAVASLLYGILELSLGNSNLIVPAIIVFVVFVVPAFILGKLWNIPLTSLNAKNKNLQQ